MPADLQDDGTRRGLLAAANVDVTKRDAASALVLFRRAARLAQGCNGVTGPSSPPWGTSVLLALRKASQATPATCVFIFFRDGTCRAGSDAAQRSLRERLVEAQRKWLSGSLLPDNARVPNSPMVKIVRDQAAADKVCREMHNEDLAYRKPRTSSDAACLQLMKGQSWDQRARQGGTSQVDSNSSQFESGGSSLANFSQGQASVCSRLAGLSEDSDLETEGEHDVDHEADDEKDDDDGASGWWPPPGSVDAAAVDVAGVPSSTSDNLRRLSMNDTVIGDDGGEMSDSGGPAASDGLFTSDLWR